jgi:hypothetical protein
LLPLGKPFINLISYFKVERGNLIILGDQGTACPNTCNISYSVVFLNKIRNPWQHYLYFCWISNLQLLSEVTLNLWHCSFWRLPHCPQNYIYMSWRLVHHLFIKQTNTSSTTFPYFSFKSYYIIDNSPCVYIMQYYFTDIFHNAHNSWWPV